MKIHGWTLLLAALAMLPYRACWAEHDIEFVAEHLPEVAMDNRYATLPVWGGSSEGPWGGVIQGAFSSTTVGSLSLEGPMLSLALQRELGGPWQAGVFGFYDDLSFSSGREHRPLQTLFAPQTPLVRPADALFTQLDGSTKHFGGGLFVRRMEEGGWLGAHHWVAGIQWERVGLRDYAFNYAILAGPQAGVTGKIDFDANYDYVAPFVGLELPRTYGRWTVALHGLVACPLPRRGVVGHITGPGFDLSGDTAAAGNGKHFGDPSVTLGLTITYLPAGLSVDLGTLVSQALIEPFIHKGIDRNLALSVFWSK